MTGAQKAALRWLFNRGGTGMFNKDGVLLAAGELAGVTRTTWNALRDAGLVSIENKRTSITDAGKQHCAANPTVRESQTVEEEY